MAERLINPHSNCIITAQRQTVKKRTLTEVSTCPAITLLSHIAFPSKTNLQLTNELPATGRRQDAFPSDPGNLADSIPMAWLVQKGRHEKSTSSRPLSRRSRSASASLASRRPPSRHWRYLSSARLSRRLNSPGHSGWKPALGEGTGNDGVLDRINKIYKIERGRLTDRQNEHRLNRVRFFLRNSMFLLPKPLLKIPPPSAVSQSC